MTNFFKTKKHVKVKIGSRIVNAEIADNFLKKAVGLIGRESLRENEGMLFLFRSEGYHKFSMCGMSIPIDIIFIGKNKIVVDIIKNAQPCGLIFKTYTPNEKATYVLEVKVNFTERHFIKIGNKVDFKLD